ncbi:MAG TPA: GNAT family N-acetyltransferase [Spirochaetes bacterium]|nr:GNAT family N-acetyltransferase [Spirochaetota bacterium]
MVYTIRKAVPGDTEAIHSVLLPYAADGIILHRDRADITDNINSFFTAEWAGRVIGVVSFYDYGERLKEIRSLAVVKENFRAGVGAALVKFLIGSLLESCPSAKIFALSFSPGFFMKLGFDEVNKDTLPEKIWKDCDHCVHKDNCGETALVYRNNGV